MHSGSCRVTSAPGVQVPPPTPLLSSKNARCRGRAISECRGLVIALSSQSPRQRRPWYRRLSRAGVSDAPQAASLIPYAGPVLAFVLEEVPAVRQAKALRMLAELMDLLGKDPSELIEILRGSQDFVELVAIASDAASRTRAEENLELIAEAARDGLGSGDAAIDLARLRIATLADLDSIHVRALREVMSTAPVETKDPILRSALGNPVGFDAVVATLIRHGLIVSVDALVGFIGPGYRITAYGIYIVSEFDRVISGPPPDAQPDVSTPS